MKKMTCSLDISRPQLRADNHKGLTLQNTLSLKKKLLEELIELEKQRKDLEVAPNSVDFSMIQTYKEMIQSRRVMFRELS